ncbi:hypothetical protein ACTHAM_000239 [Cellulomonas soli]|uniref:hypothetical protein n=1 Tax=Cellulomonas soli TaxID=931535 RepID=UPI003F85D9CE
MATSAVVVTVLVGVASLLLLAVVPLLMGTEQAGRSQTASDAAALAGAVGARDRAVVELAGAVPALRPAALAGLGGSWRFGTAAGGASGLADAAAFAVRNDAVVEEYRHDGTRDRVTVRTRATQPGPEETVVRSSASASLGVELSSCLVTADRSITGWTEPPPSPPPAPEPTPAPTPSPTPTPTPTFVPEPVYGPWSYAMTCDGDDGFSVSGPTITAVVDQGRAALDALQPRLVP